MSNQIKTFCHEKFGEIRTLTNGAGETFFVGKDVAKALGYSKPENAIATHVDTEDKTTTLIQGTGSNYKSKAVVINESGLYALILSSKLKQAKAFKRWVTSEVLPQIRRTGGYIPTHDGKGRTLSDEEIVARANEIVGRTLQAVNASNQNCLTATEVASDWGMDVRSFNAMLGRMGIQRRKRGRWVLAKDLEGLHLAEDRCFVYFSLMGMLKLRKYLVWTREGVSYINSRLKGSGEGPRVVQLNFLLDVEQ